MNIILIGTGRMGRLLKECALDAGDAVVGEYGRANIAELAAAPAADVAIDFSGPEALPAILETLLQEGYTFVPISELILPGEYNVDYTIDHTGRQLPAQPSSSPR